MPNLLFFTKKTVEMAQEQKCCVSDMGHLIPQIKSTTTTKTLKYLILECMSVKTRKTLNHGVPRPSSPQLLSQAILRLFESIKGPVSVVFWS